MTYNNSIKQLQLGILNEYRLHVEKEKSEYKLEILFRGGIEDRHVKENTFYLYSLENYTDLGGSSLYFSAKDKDGKIIKGCLNINKYDDIENVIYKNKNGNISYAEWKDIFEAVSPTAKENGFPLSLLHSSSLYKKITKNDSPVFETEEKERMDKTQVFITPEWIERAKKNNKNKFQSFASPASFVFKNNLNSREREELESEGLLPDEKNGIGAGEGRLIISTVQHFESKSNINVITVGKPDFSKNSYEKLALFILSSAKKQGAKHVMMPDAGLDKEQSKEMETALKNAAKSVGIKATYFSAKTYSNLAQFGNRPGMMLVNLGSNNSIVNDLEKINFIEKKLAQETDLLTVCNPYCNQALEEQINSLCDGENLDQIFDCEVIKKQLSIKKWLEEENNNEIPDEKDIYDFISKEEDSGKLYLKNQDFNLAEKHIDAIRQIGEKLNDRQIKNIYEKLKTDLDNRKNSNLFTLINGDQKVSIDLNKPRTVNDIRKQLDSLGYTKKIPETLEGKNLAVSHSMILKGILNDINTQNLKLTFSLSESDLEGTLRKQEIHIDLNSPNTVSGVLSQIKNQCGSYIDLGIDENILSEQAAQHSNLFFTLENQILYLSKLYQADDEKLPEKARSENIALTISKDISVSFTWHKKEKFKDLDDILKLKVSEKLKCAPADVAFDWSKLGISDKSSYQEALNAIQNNKGIAFLPITIMVKIQTCQLNKTEMKLQDEKEKIITFDLTPPKTVKDVLSTLDDGALFIATNMFDKNFDVKSLAISHKKKFKEIAKKFKQEYCYVDGFFQLLKLPEGKEKYLTNTLSNIKSIEDYKITAVPKLEKSEIGTLGWVEYIPEILFEDKNQAQTFKNTFKCLNFLMAKVENSKEHTLSLANSAENKYFFDIMPSMQRLLKEKKSTESSLNNYSSYFYLLSSTKKELTKKLALLDILIPAFGTLWKNFYANSRSTLNEVCENLDPDSLMKIRNLQLNDEEWKWLNSTLKLESEYTCSKLKENVQNAVKKKTY